MKTKIGEKLIFVGGKNIRFTTLNFGDKYSFKHSLTNQAGHEVYAVVDKNGRYHYSLYRDFITLATYRKWKIKQIQKL